MKPLLDTYLMFLIIQFLVISWRPVPFMSFDPLTPILRYRRVAPKGAHLLNDKRLMKHNVFLALIYFKMLGEYRFLNIIFYELLERNS